MAKEKDAPNLPGSSRMQMPMTSGNNTPLKIKADGNGVTSKVTKAASGKGMKGTNPYC
jgi:hypothetical protein